MPAALMNDDGFDELSDDDLFTRQINQEKQRMLQQNDDDDQPMDTIDVEDVKGKLSQWLQRPEVIRWIRKIFINFLRSFQDDSNVHIYEQRINEMCQANKQSLEVTFGHISRKFPTLAIWLAEEPVLVFQMLNEVAMELVLEVYPSYQKIHSQVFVRIRDLPVEDKLRDLRQIHLNVLIKIRGVVTKRTGVFPEL